METGVVRMAVRVPRTGSKLGFGVRHDRGKRLVVSTVPPQFPLRAGDTLVAVNGQALDGMEFLAVVELLKGIAAPTLEFQVERAESTPAETVAPTTGPVKSVAPPAPVATAPVAKAPVINAVSVVSAAVPSGALPQAGGQGSAVPFVVSAAGAGLKPIAPAVPLAQPYGMLAVGQPQPSLAAPVTVQGLRATVAQPPPRKKPRPTPKVPIVLPGDVSLAGGLAAPGPAPGSTPAVQEKPPTMHQLIAEVQRQRAAQAALESKNAGLRKRLQQMLIDCDEVRVRAAAEVQAVKEKAQKDVEEAQRVAAAARAQLRLADRVPDFAQADSLAKALESTRLEVEKLKKADAERTSLLNARYIMESRLAVREARRLIDELVVDGCAQLRVIARRDTSSNGGGAADKDVVVVAREGVRRLAFLKLFELTHDFLHYISPSFQATDVIRHEVEHDQLVSLFGSSLRHEERAGLFYVAVSPMAVTYDPKTETLELKCGWAEQNAIRELARQTRFS